MVSNSVSNSLSAFGRQLQVNGVNVATLGSVFPRHYKYRLLKVIIKENFPKIAPQIVVLLFDRNMLWCR